jgi:hypothetical protein
LVEQIASLTLEDTVVLLNERSIQWEKNGNYPSVTRSGDYLQYLMEQALPCFIPFPLRHTMH